MNSKQLQRILHQLQVRKENGSTIERLEAAKLLMDAARLCLRQAQASLREATGAAARSKAKGRETEVDVKPPLRPVSVAAPSKPTKPKYSGNHAPSAPRR